MAKSKDDTLKYLLVGGILVYFFTRQQQQNQNQGNWQWQQPQVPVYQNYPSVPQAPPRNNQQAWQQWINTIIGLYGEVATLWQPGGPFYKENVQPQEIHPVYTDNPWLLWP